jgi:hypothetical protein
MDVLGCYLRLGRWCEAVGWKRGQICSLAWRGVLDCWRRSFNPGNVEWFLGMGKGHGNVSVAFWCLVF